MIPVIARPRLAALDALRGLVMILMSIDHASGAFNAGRLFTDSFVFYKPGTPLPAAQFLTRFITHLCAPTFVFLAGAAGALSAERRIAAGEREREVDRHLWLRGVLIALCDPTWMSLGFTGFRIVLFQVLYAIGSSMMFMAVLRRLPSAALITLALGLIFGGEALIGATTALVHDGGPAQIAAAFLLTGGKLGKLVIAYPTLPWLAIMMLGWVFGRALAFSKLASPQRLLLRAGLAALALFFVVRGLNAYGQLRLRREDGSLVQWLHLSKYPPSLGYYALLLGTMALLLLLFMRREARGLPPPAPLVVLGRTAFFFYLLHVHVLELIALVSGSQHSLGLWSAYVFGLGVVGLLYPLCVRYDVYKRAHPNGFTRYL